MKSSTEETLHWTEASGGADPGLALLQVKGMNCQGCVRTVTEALRSVPGVEEVAVDLEGGQATVRWSANAVANAGVLVERLRQAGYHATPLTAGTEPQSRGRARRWQWNLRVGVAATVPLILGEWAFGWGMEQWFQWLAFGLAAVVQGFGGAPFYRGAWQQLRVRQANMDTLVALGSTTAFGYSVWVLFGGVGGHVYFMESAAIITLISLGHWLEARMSARATAALRALMQLRPPEARRLRPGPVPEGAPWGPVVEEEVVPVPALQVGDRVVLRPGERVPVDGEVLEGKSAVDESMLTGEAEPVQKQPGSRLLAGTLVMDGRLVVQVTATGHATVLAGIIRAVQRAQQSRAAIQRLGDRVSSVFVPAVIVVAIAAGLWWGLWPESARTVHDGLARWLWAVSPPEGMAAPFIVAAAVLIVACPCAMGLATPAAIMAAANVAARRGILLRDGVALEKAGRISTVLFDKTGTLTEGRPQVLAAQDMSDDEVEPWQVAALLAERSLHPVSRAVSEYCRERLRQQRPSGADPAGSKPVTRELALTDWREVRGAGLEARRADRVDIGHDGDDRLRLGSLRWLEGLGVDIGPAERFTREWTEAAATVVGLATGKRLLTVFALRDRLKPSARQVVQRLHGMGLRVGMVTGDRTEVARTMARELGLDEDEVLAEVRPEAKADRIRQLQARGERVAFVGDGINDAPALEQADLGIAVARASDIARESADLVLLRSDLPAVPEAIGLARASLRTIYQNLFWAFFYNAAAVPLAALGFLSPVLCALAMGLSDLIVIGNALRLRSWQPMGH